MRTFIIILGVLTILGNKAAGQGCVAIRGSGSFCSKSHNDKHADTTKWSLTINNRYFKSFRHFVGTVEQKQRIALGTEVVNHTYSTNFFLTRKLNNGWSLAVDLPITANTRSSLYEHGGRSRHSTESFGIGDIRLIAYKWLIDPMKSTKANVQLGFGLKLPTGEYRYMDKFFVNDTTTIVGPVDQSIQLGDGGTGFTVEANAYYMLSKTVSLYGNFYYLLNPREQNGVSTARGATPSAAAIRYGSDVMSVPDQYMWRAGANVELKHVSFSAGVRHECIPMYDLIGGSNGFRRPGYVISAEPGFTWNFKKVSVYSFVPVVLKRSRTQSIPDKIRTQVTGVYAQGDAAFADYSINVGMRFSF
ncbi:MAG: hypothetical protein RLY16_3090 [Bacteroidota bacterium]|jgi:hypothetical protein